MFDLAFQPLLARVPRVFSCSLPSLEERLPASPLLGSVETSIQCTADHFVEAICNVHYKDPGSYVFVFTP